jgi:AcrR family transcriptional regulator
MPRVVPTYADDAKKRILQAASEQFKEKGYFRSTMDDVAGRLGISKGAIYRYFGSKEELLAALYSSAPDNLRSLFTVASGDPVTASKEVFEKMATRPNANLFVDFLAEASVNVDFQKILRENIERFSAALEDTIVKKNPRMTSKDLARLHDSIVTLGLCFNGLLCWLTVGVSEQDVKRTWAKSVESLLGPVVGEKKSQR